MLFAKIMLAHRAERTQNTGLPMKGDYEPHVATGQENVASPAYDVLVENTQLTLKT